MVSLQQQYVYNQTGGAVTEPINGSWLAAYADYLGITEPSGTWIQAICEHFGITSPVYGSWTIALASHYGITNPENGTWWYAIANASAGILPIADFTSNFTTITEGDSVNFTDLSTVPSGGPAITAWLWTFTGATPSTSTLQNPTGIVWNTPGTYEVSLQVTNADGSNTKTVPNYMTVNVIPVVADFSADDTTPVAGDTVTFTDLSTGSPTSWSWIFEGGTPATSTLQNPQVQWAVAGTYDVTLTASKTGSSDMEYKKDYITATAPAPPFTPYSINSWSTTAFNPVIGPNTVDVFTPSIYIR